MRTQRIGTMAALLSTLLAPVGCTEGGSTGPVPPPPGPALDNVQTVTVELVDLVITGSCDHDSLFESSSDGEFSFSFEVTPSGSQSALVWNTANQSYAEQRHSLAGIATVFNRNVTEGEDFRVDFTGTELDGGFLGADGQFAGRGTGRDHRYMGGEWTDVDATLELVGSKPKCGATLQYTISSVAAG